MLRQLTKSNIFVCLITAQIIKGLTFNIYIPSVLIKIDVYMSIDYLIYKHIK